MSKPQIDVQAGPAPTDLVIDDITVGDGAEAVPGGTVEVEIGETGVALSGPAVLVGDIALAPGMLSTAP